MIYVIPCQQTTNLSSSINLINDKKFVDQMKKQPKFDVSLQPFRFTIYSVMVF